jgi:hypothetical protein
VVQNSAPPHPPARGQHSLPPNRRARTRRPSNAPISNRPFNLPRRPGFLRDDIHCRRRQASYQYAPSPLSALPDTPFPIPPRPSHPSYKLSQHGSKLTTNLDNALSVSIIDAPDFNALSQCTFYTEGTKALVLSISSEGLQQIIVGPPQPITAVACSGTCVPVYGMWATVQLYFLSFPSPPCFSHDIRIVSDA